MKREARTKMVNDEFDGKYGKMRKRVEKMREKAEKKEDIKRKKQQTHKRKKELEKISKNAPDPPIELEFEELEASKQD